VIIMPRRETVHLQLFHAGRPVGNTTTVDVDPRDGEAMAAHLTAAMSRARIKPEKIGECAIEARYPHNGWLVTRFVAPAGAGVSR
jgi:hypothetical protein